VSLNDARGARGHDKWLNGRDHRLKGRPWLNNFSEEDLMSTTETHAIPTGTWALDPVHSTLGFAVGYMAGTFTAGFGDFDTVVTDGQ
jgi:hypothetical protein